MDGLSGSASQLTGTAIGQPLFQLRLEGKVLECRAVGSCRTAGTSPIFFSPRVYQDAMKALDACFCFMCEVLPPCAGVTWVLSLPAQRQRCRQADLPCPATRSPEEWRGENLFWRTGNNAAWGESIGLMKQERLGRVLALETCQKWDKCRSAISDLYSWLFPGSVHSPFPAVLGWR